jgi:hypothetical protein
VPGQQSKCERSATLRASARMARKHRPTPCRIVPRAATSSRRRRGECQRLPYVVARSPLSDCPSRSRSDPYGQYSRVARSRQGKRWCCGGGHAWGKGLPGSHEAWYNNLATRSPGRATSSTEAAPSGNSAWRVGLARRAHPGKLRSDGWSWSLRRRGARANPTLGATSETRSQALGPVATLPLFPNLALWLRVRCRSL